MAKHPEPDVAVAAGPTFDVVVAPTQPVVGVVRDGATGRPPPGVVVKSWIMASRPTMLAVDFVRTTTDEQGRYRLTGLPKGPGHTIIAVPPGDKPYRAALAPVGAAGGVEPVAVDIPLRRGVVVRGRVTGGPRGHPVREQVEYYALRSNPETGDAPGFDGTIRSVPTGPDGSFAVAALPGPGLLAVRADDRFALTATPGTSAPWAPRPPVSIPSSSTRSSPCRPGLISPTPGAT